MKLRIHICLLICSLILTLSSRPISAETAKEDPTAAVVNGEVITITRINEEVQRQPMLAYQKMLAKDDQKRVRIVQLAGLNAIIDRKLLLETAKKSGLVDEKEVNIAIDTDLKSYGTKAQLTDMLTQIGSTYDQFIKDISDSHRIRSYLEKSVMKGIKVTPEEVKAEFEKTPDKYVQKEAVHARHILVKVDEGAPETAWKSAEEKVDAIYTEAAKPGADFGKIAFDKSDCPSKSRGGDLGFFAKGAMVPEFETVAFSLKDGEISKPVKTRFGYHVIKVEGRKPASAAKLETAKDEIERELFTKKRQDIVIQEIARLRKEAKIDIQLKPLA